MASVWMILILLVSVFVGLNKGISSANKTGYFVVVCIIAVIIILTIVF